jgi:hypothetical protein
MGWSTVSGESDLMKAYLVTTGSVFGLIALMHGLKAIGDRHLLTTQPVEFLSMAALGLVAAALSLWAWRLLKGMKPA